MIANLKRLTRHSMVYGLGHVAARSIGFLLLPLHTNYLAENLYGVASLLFAYLAVMTILYGFGVDSAFLRYYVLAASETEKRDTFSTAFWAVLMTGIIFSAVVFVWAAPLSAILLDNSGHAALLRLCTGILFLDALAVLSFLLLRAEERSLIFAIQKFANVAVNLLLNYLFIVTFNRGLRGLFEAHLVSSAFTFMVLLPFSVRRLRPAVDRATIKKLLAFGLPYLPSTLAVVAIDIMDRFILKSLTDVRTVGLYSAGYKLGMIMSLVVAAFRFAWVPFFLNTSRQQNAPITFSRVLTYFTLVCATVFLATSLFVDDLVRLELGSLTVFGPKYWHSTVVVPVVLLAYLLFGLQLNFIVGIYLKEKTAYLPAITIAGAVVNAAMNFVLIPILGMIGAAWSTVLAYAVMTMLTYRVSQRLYPIHYEISRLAKISVVTGALFFINYFVPLAIPLRVGLLLFFPWALAALGFFEKRELDFLARALHLNRRIATSRMNSEDRH